MGSGRIRSGLCAVWGWLIDAHSGGPGGTLSSGFGLIAFAGVVVALGIMLLFPSLIPPLGVIAIVLVVAQLVDIVVMNLPRRRRRR